MRHIVVGVAVLLGLACVSVLGGAVEMRGTVGGSVDLLPSFGARLEGGVTLSGDAWTFGSGTTVDVIPLFGIDEILDFTYELGFATFAAQVAMEIVPWTFGSATLSATLELFGLEIAEEDPTVSLRSTFTVGALLDGRLDPFTDFSARIQVGLRDHSLTSTTTLSLLPLDIASTLLVHLSLGRWVFGDGDDAPTLSASTDVSLSLVPLGFSYVQIAATAGLGRLSLTNTVTYSGGASFLAQSTATVDLDPVVLKAWASYSSTAASGFAAGISASLAWGPAEL